MEENPSHDKVNIVWLQEFILKYDLSDKKETSGKQFDLPLLKWLF